MNFFSKSLSHGRGVCTVCYAAVWRTTLKPDLADVGFYVGAKERMPPVTHRPPYDHNPLKAGPSMFIHNSGCVVEQSISLWLETRASSFVANDKKK